MIVKGYTDGSCINKIGGWGWILYYEKFKNRSSFTVNDWGGYKNTTNQRMELAAMAELLSYILPFGCGNSNESYEIYSDSKYVLGGIIGIINTKDCKISSLYDYYEKGKLK